MLRQPAAVAAARVVCGRRLGVAAAGPAAAVVRQGGAGLAAASTHQRRWKLSGKNRFNPASRRAMEQHVDYLRQLKPPKPYRRAEVDPKVMHAGLETKHVFGFPQITEQPPPEVALKSFAQVDPVYKGRLGDEVKVPGFGSQVEVVHGDIFDAGPKAWYGERQEHLADVVILPVPQNLAPYRGLALEAYDRGNKQMVEAVVRAAPPNAQPGDAFDVDARGAVPGAKKIVFAVMPWVWQGSPLDAAKRLRYCVKQALRHAWGLGLESVALPNIACGIFGYEPRRSSTIILEEVFEALLQIEAQTPQYPVRRVTLIDSRRETAELMRDALSEVSHRWVPSYRLTTAAQYWGKETRRLMVVPDGQRFFLKRHRVKFCRNHGVKRRHVAFYLSNMKPLFWRPQKVHQPPPALVYRETGEMAKPDLQIKPRPFFYRGVSHWLFPSRRSGFHNLRKSASGRWTAQGPRKRAGGMESHLIRPRM